MKQAMKEFLLDNALDNLKFLGLGLLAGMTVRLFMF